MGKTSKVSDECTKCAGCGQVANTKNQEPWSEWQDLPRESCLAVRIGLVRAIICPECKGSGRRKNKGLDG